MYNLGSSFIITATDRLKLICGVSDYVFHNLSGSQAFIRSITFSRSCTAIFRLHSIILSQIVELNQKQNLTKGFSLMTEFLSPCPRNIHIYTTMYMRLIVFFNKRITIGVTKLQNM